MLIPTLMHRQGAAGARALGPTVLALVLSAAACVDPAATGPTTPAAVSASRVSSAAPTIALAPPQSGIECACTRVGAYVDPDAGKAIATTREGSSPNGVHTLTATAIGTTYTLRISRGGTFVKEFSGLPSTTSWGFSPDDHRFVYHYLSGTAPSQTHDIYPYDLAAGARSPVAEFHDVLGVARQPNQTQVTARLVRTRDGGVVTNSERTFPLASVAFRSTLADHLAASGGVHQPPLASNTADDPCQVTVPTLGAVSLSPSSVLGGGTSTCTVTLSGPAPAGGVAVTLASGNPSVATVLPAVTVPAGSTSATATVQTAPVTASTAVTITAAASGVTRTATLTVTAPPPPSKLLSVGPTGLTFASQAVGTTGAAQSVTVTNTGTLAVTISGIAAGGDFAQTNGCPLPPAPSPPGRAAR